MCSTRHAAPASLLVAMFNLLAEQWRRENPTRREHTRAKALLDILQKQIRGVDMNPDACRITAFSLYLALLEKLQPIDVEEFKKKIRQGPFLPALVWTRTDPIDTPVILDGDFLNDVELPLENDFDLVIGNPPWESRGNEQIALRFALRSADFLRSGSVGCCLPSAILVNRHRTLDGNWFRKVTLQKILQLADFRRVLFEAAHAYALSFGIKTRHLFWSTRVAYENTPRSSVGTVNPTPSGAHLSLSQMTKSLCRSGTSLRRLSKITCSRSGAASSGGRLVMKHS